MAFVRFLLFAFLTGAVLTELSAPFEAMLLGAVVIGAIGAWLTEPKGNREAADPNNLHVRVTSLERDLWKTQQRVVELERVLSRAAVPVVAPLNVEAQTPTLAPPLLDDGDPPIAPLPSIPTPEPAADVPTGPPSPIAVETASIWRFFVGENAAVRIGILVLLLGLGFLLKYVADQGLFPPVVRLGVAAASGIGLLGLGFVLRRRRRLYGLALLGGGFATLFLCVYASEAVLGLVDVSSARLGYVSLSAGFLVAALVLAEESLSILAVIGALGAPFLNRTGGGYERLLAYDAIMAIVVAVIALRFGFQRLPKVAAVFTYAGLGIAAGVVSSGHAVGYLPLLSLAVLTLGYSGLPAANALLGRECNAAILIFGAPMASLGIATVLYGASWHSPALRFGTAQAVFAIATVALLWRRAPVLARSQMLVAFGLIALVTRHYLGQSPATVAWAIEAVGAVYLGLHQRDRFLTLFGVVLSVVLMTYLGWPPRRAWPDEIPFWNGAVVAAAACGAAPLIVGALLHRRPTVPFALASAVALSLAGLAHLAATLVVQTRHGTWNGDAQRVAIVIGFSVLALVAELLGTVARTDPALVASDAPRKGSFRALRNAAMLVPVILTPFSALDLILSPSVARLTFAAHLLALGVSAFVVRRREPAGWLSSLGHLLTTASLTMLPAGAIRLVAPNHPALGATLGVLSMMGLALFWTQSTRARGWLLPSDDSADPLADAAARKRVAAVTTGGLLLVLSGALLLLGFSESGPTPPVPYLPVVGLVDLTLTVTMVALFHMAGTLDALSYANAAREARVGLGLLGLILIASILARAIAHYGALEFSPSLLKSTIYQASLSLTYGLIGLAVMIVGTRRTSRGAYVFGAVLLGLVVVKLLVVDLASTGTLARIVSFIGTGVILLVVGYFVPLPPKRTPRTGNP